MVEYQLSYSQQAKFDLNNIYQYINSNSDAKQAQYVVGTILDAIEKIRIFPFKHPHLQTHPINIRFAVKWKYKIFFSINDNTITILQIMHGSRNPSSLFF